MVQLALINGDRRSIDYEQNMKRVSSMKNQYNVVQSAKKEIHNYDQKLARVATKVPRSNLRTLDSISTIQGAQLRSNQSYDFSSNYN